MSTNESRLQVVSDTHRQRNNMYNISCEAIFGFWKDERVRGLAAYASNVSFGHTEHCFLTVWTPKSLSEFADDDFS